MQAKEIIVNGVPLHYSDSGTGTPVIFVHGDLQDYRTWEPQRNAFLRDYRFISYSRRYHYPNTCTEDGSDYTAALHVEDLTVLIQTLDLPPAHIVACSYGGLIALLLSKQSPELLRTLVLNEAGIVPWFEILPGGLEHLKHFISAREVAMPRFTNGALKEGMRLAFNAFWGDGAFEKLPEAARAGAVDNTPALRAAAFSRNLYGTFLPEDAEKIKLPALLVSGEHALQPFNIINSELACFLQNNELVTVPGAGHLMHIDNPVAYNRLVLDFLKKH